MKIIATLLLIVVMLALFASNTLFYASLAALALVVVCKVVTVFFSALFNIANHNNGSYHEHRTS